ncbi:hypothetical protein BDN72DRAFT_872083 [Pluteus cervinus]|uniref:Uncharacterized protein n=1 Tax=Pluteus cervinus TaxID=181527 RepID=A0ACD3AFZ3_9AGAR|nr:hypothetical protein BDN72DRAFT_872083 [Pluteus cervinus]
MFSAVQLLFALLLPLANAAIGPVGDLPITNVEIAPDGVSRPAVVAGGSFPGLLIQGNKGDRFQLNVQDQLTDSRMLKSTSIHWHGLLQRGSAWADGPVGVTQCPIALGNSFLYDFAATDQAGTFWYHSHYSTQYCDGLRGPFVVYDPEDPHLSSYGVDDESTVITLADWYHTPALAGPSLPQPDTTLINGIGRWGSDPTADLAVINVAAGNRYRLRYSFILEANQTVGNYWIRALPNIQSIRGQRFENGVNSAILRYDTAPDAEPTTSELSNPTVLNEADVRPLVITPAVGVHELGAADIKSTLNMTIPALAAGGPHPMHSHGHTFQVIRSAGSNQLNWDNPISRDVVSSGTSGSVVIRFTTDNPGPWILHCHIDWHFELGLAVVFAESIDDIATSHPPPAWDSLCDPFDALAPSEH